MENIVTATENEAKKLLTELKAEITAITTRIKNGLYASETEVKSLAHRIEMAIEEKLGLTSKSGAGETNTASTQPVMSAADVLSSITSIKPSTPGAEPTPAPAAEAASEPTPAPAVEEAAPAAEEASSDAPASSEEVPVAASTTAQSAS